ncbi:diaminopimelate decarboxylase [Alkalilimnicola sp. S0819]|uniref:diaminopimelate decarboxylase n=1 Tax=Alkalilimnicola sp. S0819 TaxID=2613922 RepID=UPI0012626FE2|nr:diaminopimelate decarboxylase [Alkalilimnicola sp. S0819]KAB7622739.1 diaminopimelate decarboxylase [Alkalilimnicola sp. S0819]MPQ17346.1 diaminopimelate decarboxylase [Alkalilimnicola sp. S0819]
MDALTRREDGLYLEDCRLQTLAEEHGTPCYVYSRAAIESAWRAFDQAFAGQDHLICYAVKANSNLAVLNLLARLGSGFDIVSGGELARVLAAGGDPAKVVFSGVGKTAEEMRLALEHNILCFNVESEPELERLNAVAGELGRIAPVSLRVNPDVDAQTHPYISTGLKENKFGIEFDRAEAACQRVAELPNLHLAGLDCHIGSQLTSTRPFADALGRILALLERLEAQGFSVEHLDIGGGLGIRYQDETPPAPAEYAAAILERLGDRQIKLLMEPGRAIVGNAGVLLTRVEYLKHTPHKNFCVVDAAMNDLLRPALYQSWQGIEPLRPRDAPSQRYDVVGPVCETGDFLGKDRDLAVEAGDLLAVRSSGAYGFVMSSNYNSRPRAAELLVDGERVHVARRRETVEELWQGEAVLPA